jgi:predicted metalloprotease
VIDTLLLSDETPATGGNGETPEPTEAPTVGASAGGYADLLQDIEGDGDAPSNSDDLLALFQTSIVDINGYWEREFPILTGGLHYAAPKAYIPFIGTIDTPCGPADSFDEASGTGSGPFYCPDDQIVYIDMGFANYQFDAVANIPFLIPAVLAHETGHHVQTLLGMQDCTETPCLDPNQLTSQEIEYMADCYGGAWSQDAELRGRLGANDVDANIVQYALLLGGGEESADPGGHGRGAERIWWFLNGYLDGAAKCYETSSVTKDWAQTGPPNPLSSTQQGTEPTPDNTQPTEETTDEATSTPNTNGGEVSAIGDAIDSSEGTLTFTKTDTDTSIGNTDADGQFLIVFFEVDRGDTSGPFNYDAWTLTDSDGNAYDVDSRATDLLLSSAYDDGIDEVLDAGDGYNVAMVFDVPTDASGFTLVNDDEGIQVQLGQ